jgi:hypothetical protein
MDYVKNIYLSRSGSDLTVIVVPEQLFGTVQIRVHSFGRGENTGKHRWGDKATPRFSVTPALCRVTYQFQRQRGTTAWRRWGIRLPQSQRHSRPLFTVHCTSTVDGQLVMVIMCCLQTFALPRMARYQSQ